MRKFDAAIDVFTPEVFDGGSPAAEHMLLAERGYSLETELNSLSLKDQTDMAIELMHKAYNELNLAKLPDLEKKKIKDGLGSMHLRFSANLFIAMTLDQMSLPIQTNLGQLSSQQKHELTNRMQKQLTGLGVSLPNNLQKEFASDVNKQMDLMRTSLDQAGGELQIHPIGWIGQPFSNVWDYILSCLPFSGCEREHNEKTGETTYTYRDGSKKVIDKDGNWVEYDKKGNVAGQGSGDTFEGWVQPFVDLWEKWGPYIKFISLVVKLAATLGLIPPVLGYLTWTDAAFLIYDGYEAEGDAWKD